MGFVAGGVLGSVGLGTDGLDSAGSDLGSDLATGMTAGFLVSAAFALVLGGVCFVFSGFSTAGFFATTFFWSFAVSSLAGDLG